MSKSKSICIRLEDDLFNKLDSMAKEDDRTVSYLIRKILREYLAKYPPAVGDDESLS